MRSIELWCAIAHLRSSRFRVWSYGPSRNDGRACFVMAGLDPGKTWMPGTSARRRASRFSPGHDVIPICGDTPISVIASDLSAVAQRAKAEAKQSIVPQWKYGLL